MSGLPGLDTSMLTFASRLATFNIEHQVAKRRASSQKKKQPSTVSWPHESPSAEELARAGFFYKPAPDSDDNVQCFHCAVKLDGWESEDIPLREHLAHSSQCAWATSLSVSDKAEDRDPMDPDLLEARRSTFADLWPHEKKKGWKCKVNKMVEAGWAYDPSPSDEDGATCFYCNMSLDGWEPKDNPTDEHRRREPNCPFFALVEHYKPTRKGARGRTSTASKASRLSTQSMKSTFSEAPSLMSLGDAGPDTDMEESLAIDTTVASETGKGRKKTTKGTKKNSRLPSVEPSVSYPTLQDAVDDTIEPVTMEEKPKAKRGRKAKNTQDSTIIDDSTIAEPTKKKTTRGRAKAKQSSPEPRISQDESQLQSELQEAAEFASALQSPQPENTRGVKRTSDGLEKTITNEEVTVEEAPTKPKKAAKVAKGKKGKKATQESQDESEAPAEDSTDIAASQADIKPKRVRSKKAKKVEPEPELEPEVYSDHEQEVEPEIQEMEPEEEPNLESQPEDLEGAYDELEPQQDVNEELEREIQEEPEAEDDEQPGEIIEQEPEVEEEDELEEDEQIEQEVEHEAEVEAEVEAEEEVEVEAEEEPVQSPVHEDENPHEEEAEVEDEVEVEVEQLEHAASLAPTPAAEEFEPTPTPRATRLSVVHRQTPEPAPQSAHSTPQSQQSSDAENHPPSSSTHAQTTIKKPAALATETENSALKPKEIFASPSKAVRVPLATSTPKCSPSRRSPSKFGQLTSSVPWEPVDLDAVFYPLTDNENANEDDIFAKMLEAGGALTTPEKKMNVEEWIRWRAELGETKLKNECERMVTLFEREANRGLQALNGIKTVE